MSILEQLNSGMMPFTRHLGIVFLAAEKGGVRAQLAAEQCHCTLPPIVHGGVLMSMADSAGAVGAFLNLREGSTGTTTIESKTNLVSAAKVGDLLFVDAMPMHIGSRTQLWESRVTRQSGELVSITWQTQLAIGT